MNARTVPTRLACLVTALAFALPARAADEPKPLPWEFPQEIAVAGRRLLLAEPSVLSRDAETGAVKLRFAAKVVDALGREFMGSADCEGASHLDLTSRLFKVDGIKSATALQPQLPDTDREQVVAAWEKAFPKEFTLRLELLTAAPWAAPKEPLTQGKISLLKPEILVRTSPAVLVQVDGDPVLQPVGDFPLEYVINSASDIFHEAKPERWVLLADGRWFESKKLEGPFTPATATLPLVLSQMPETHPRFHARRYVPGAPDYVKPKDAPAKAPPLEVLVRKEPAELVLLAGEPLLTWIPGTKLMNVANTESDLFFHPKSNAYYLTFAGRWFQAEDAAGPWKEAFGGLPEDFKAIPRDHPRGHVVWSVPGTPECAEAVARSLLEEEATMGKAIAVEILYEGKAPETVPVATPAGDVKMVVNSDDDIFQAENAWWCCARGIWLKSGDGTSGWQPATAIPKALTVLPEASGAFHLRFAKPLGVVPEGTVHSVSGGYSGLFVVNGTTVYGAGWTRRGAMRGGNWYPWPRTYGENRWYDPVAGIFQPRTVRYGEDGRAAAAEWSPYTASYGRIQHYADRYHQGGRRMFQWNEGESRFELSAPRPDVYATWGTMLKNRDGILPDKWPLGDRTNEPLPKAAAVVADEKGAGWRAGEKGALETWDGKAWVVPKDPPSDEVKAWLAVLGRVNARPGQLRAWAARRGQALPVNTIR